jgi:uncharacterized protein YdgA (DUF945 family)
MNVKDEKGGEAVMGPIRFDYDLKRAFKYLFTGKVSFAMESLTATMPQPTGAGNMEMRDLGYEVVTTANGDYLDASGKVGVGSLTVATLKSAAVHYDFSLRHLHGPTYAALSEKLREVYAAVAAGDDKAAQQVIAPFKEYGAALLEHQPELTFERISMAVPEGAVQLTGKLSIPGYAHGDLDAGPMVLLPKIEALMDVTLDEGFLNRDWGATSPTAAASAANAPAGKGPHARAPAADALAPPSRPEAMKSQLAALEQQGFVTRHGTQLSSHIEFRHGALTVNGKPMGPQGAGR